jgi:predicted MFS family arabinose efflux permease
MEAERRGMRWAILLQLYLCMLSYAVVFQSIPPVMSLVISQFGLSHHQAGLLMSMFALPGVFVSLPAGMLADRHGVKAVGIVSLAVTIAGSFLVALGLSFPLVLTGRVVAGIGASSLVIIIPQAIAQWFSDRHMGVAMGIFNTAMPIGTIVSLNTFAAMAGVWGWRSGIWTTILFTALALLVFAVFYRRPVRATKGERQVSPKEDGSARVGSHIWFVGSAWALFNASIIALFTFAPDYLVGRGLGLSHAGFSTSLVMVGSMCLSPVVGFLVDRVGRKERFIAIGGFGMAVVLALFPVINHNFSLALLCVGFAAALIPAPIFSLAADVVSSQRLGLGYGILSMLNNVGIFVGPQLVGFSHDATGSYSASFWLMAFFAILSSVAILALFTKRRSDSRVG